MFKLYVTGDLGFEFWMDVPGYEGLYQASTYGRVRSLDKVDSLGRLRKGQLIKPQRWGRYLKVILAGHFESLHRLIAKTFLPNPCHKPAVDHKDANPYNCRAENLHWVSYSENSRNPITLKRMVGNRDAKGGKRASQKTYVYNTDGELVGVYKSIAEAARQTGRRPGNARQCVLGMQKTVKGLIFRTSPI